VLRDQYFVESGDSDRTDRLIEMTGSCTRQKSASLSSKRSIMTLYGAIGSTCARYMPRTNPDDLLTANGDEGG